MARKQVANTEVINTTAKSTNHLKIRIDDLKTFEPLTENQRANVVKVSSGEYHSCVLLDNGLCDCFGLTGTAGYTLSRPE